MSIPKFAAWSFLGTLGLFAAIAVTLLAGAYFEIPR